MSDEGTIGQWWSERYDRLSPTAFFCDCAEDVPAAEFADFIAALRRESDQ